jgi:hypothetical protein
MFILQAAQGICCNGSPIRDCNQAFERIQHGDDLKNFSEFAQGFAIARAQICHACLPRLPDTNLTLNRTVKRSLPTANAFQKGHWKPMPCLIV